MAGFSCILNQEPPYFSFTLYLTHDYSALTRKGMGCDMKCQAQRRNKMSNNHCHLVLHDVINLQQSRVSLKAVQVFQTILG